MTALARLTRPGRSRRPASGLIGVLFTAGFLLATAVPAMACSCMGPQPMAAYANDPNQVVFTGAVMPLDARGVPVQVTRWFQGAGPAPVVYLDGSGFGGDGASCGTPVPPAGAEWIFVAWRPETGDLVVNLCSPHAPASDPAGQAMFKDAVATFGEGLTPESEPTSTSPVEGGGQPADLPLIVGGALILVTVVAVGAVVLARRGRGDEIA